MDEIQEIVEKLNREHENFDKNVDDLILKRRGELHTPSEAVWEGIIGALDELVDDQLHYVNQMKKLYLLLDGFYQQNKGWRMAADSFAPEFALLSPEDIEYIKEQDFFGAIERLDTGLNNADMDLLERLYQTLPAIHQKVLGAGAQNRERMFNSITTQRGVRALLRSEFEYMRTELDYDFVNPLQKLMIDAILTSWLRLQLADIHVSNCALDASHKHKKHLQQTAKACQFRFTKACEAFARVQKLQNGS